MDNIFDTVKRAVNISDVIERFGVKLDRYSKALCPFHKEDTPSFSVKKNENIFHCFGCGAGGDAVAFVSKIKGIEPLDATKLLADMFNIGDAADRRGRRVGSLTEKGINSARRANVSLKRGITEYIRACAADADRTDYLIKRGLTEDSIRRFHLGFDAQKRRVVIPYSSQLDYYQTRSIEGKEFRKPTTEEAGSEPLWGVKSLDAKDAVFVVESPFCAISIEQCGGRAVSVCGATGGQKLLSEIKGKKLKCILILAYDNDEPGQKAQQELANQLFEIGAKYIPYNVAGDCKDPNELLVKNPAQLTQNIVKAVKEAKAKYRTRKDSISASELFEQAHEKPRMVVENLIVEGLTLFCAPQKIGKSWLVFDLCFTVAEGKDFWAYKTEQCEALYYSLEDPEWRIIDRMRKLFKGKCPPRGVHIITESDKLGAGLLEHMQDEIDRNPKIGLVVIDTLKMVRKINTKNNDIYGHDYEELGAIKKFAEKNKLAIVVVHHNRKSKDENDPFTNVLGTGGLTGTADTTMVMMKDKRMKDKEATLSITGRDVEEREIVVEWIGNGTWRWVMAGNAEDMQAKREREEYENDPLVIAVKALMKTQPYCWQGTPSELLRIIFDMTGNMAQTPATIGAKIQKWKNKLYYDGICHEEKKVRGQKKHVYYLRGSRHPLYSLAEKNDDD